MESLSQNKNWTCRDVLIQINNQRRLATTAWQRNRDDACARSKHIRLICGIFNSYASMPVAEPSRRLKNPLTDAQYGESHMGAIVKSHLLVLVLLQVALLGPASAADGKPDECGLASVYSSTTEETASGEDTLPGDFTAAHRSLPFGTLVHVDNQTTGRSAVVRITDRGPFISGRIIDVS